MWGREASNAPRCYLDSNVKILAYGLIAAIASILAIAGSARADVRIIDRGDNFECLSGEQVIAIANALNSANAPIDLVLLPGSFPSQHDSRPENQRRVLALNSALVSSVLAGRVPLIVVCHRGEWSVKVQENGNNFRQIHWNSVSIPGTAAYLLVPEMENLIIPF